MIGQRRPHRKRGEKIGAILEREGERERRRKREGNEKRRTIALDHGYARVKGKRWSHGK